MDGDILDSLGKIGALAWTSAGKVPLVGAPVQNLTMAGAVGGAVPYELGKGVYDGANTAAGVVQDISRNNKFALPNAPINDSDPINNGSIPGRAFEAAGTLAAMNSPLKMPEGSLGALGGGALPLADSSNENYLAGLRGAIHLIPRSGPTNAAEEETIAAYNRLGLNISRRPDQSGWGRFREWPPGANDPTPTWEETMEGMRRQHAATNGNTDTPSITPPPSPAPRQYTLPLSAQNDPAMESLWNRFGRRNAPSEPPMGASDYFSTVGADNQRRLYNPAQLEGPQLDAYVNAYYDHKLGNADHGILPSIVPEPSVSDLQRTSNPNFYSALAAKYQKDAGTYYETDPSFVKAFGNEVQRNSAQPVMDMLKHSGVDPHDFAQGMFGPHEAMQIMPGTGVNAGKFTLQAAPLTPDGEVMGSMAREFDPATKNVYHDFFEMHEEHQGKGYGKDILANQVDQYNKLGINSVSLLANIDVGGYAWAKYGFQPKSPQDWTNLKNRYLNKRFAAVQDQLDPETASNVKSILASSDPSAIHEIANIKNPVMSKSMYGEGAAGQANDAESLPFGKHMLLNSDWQGKMDLKDPATMAMFNKYTRPPK